VAYACDMQCGSFQVVFVSDYQIDDLYDVCCFVEGSIYIVDWDHLSITGF